MARRGRKPKPPDQIRQKLNLTVHPDIREWADAISHKRRRSVSQLFEELVEAEWLRYQAAPQNPPPPPPAPVPQPHATPFYPPPYPYHYAHPQAPPTQQ
jgi:hypothetical protein